jgi:transcriptional regulator with XRE-family HTH domain
MSIGKKIRELRDSKGLSQVDLASAIGVSKGAISQWETGLVKNITGKTLLKLAKALGTTPDVLLQIGELPVSLPSHEENVLNLYRALSAKHKEIAIRLLKAL